MDPKVLHFFQEHGIPCATVSGNSMNPLLSDGEVVSVSRDEPRIGDIVVFKKDEVLFIHRLIFTIGRIYYTMGDNSSFPDRPVRREDILGVVRGGDRERFSFLSRVRAVLILLKSRLQRFHFSRPGQ